jgi:hypothetical protein
MARRIVTLTSSCAERYCVCPVLNVRGNSQQPRPDQGDGAFIRLEERREHVAAGPSAERRHQQVAIRLAFERAMIAWCFRRRFLKTLQRPIEPLTRPEAEKVVAVADQRVGLGDAEAVATLWLMHDPRAAVSEEPAHLGNRDVHRMPRHDRAVPRLAYQLIAIDDAPAVRRQRAKDVKRLRPHAQLGSVS